MCEEQRESEPLAPPQRLELPCFVYGVFKPGELAHAQLAPLLDAPPEPATAAGVLWIRDGLPVVSPEGARLVRGFLLRFGSHAREAYAAICRLEPKHHYKWEERELVEPTVKVNVLVARGATAGAEKSDTGWWTSEQDPVFREGMSEVEKVIRADALDRSGEHREFPQAPPEYFDWGRLFRLQMAYLLLWSAIERYTALAFGSALGPNVRLRLLGTDNLFRAGLEAVEIRESATVMDSRKPKRVFVLSRNDPAESAEYYYQIRNNLTHRGKGVTHDGEKVRQSLIELRAIFASMLQRSVFAPRSCPE